MLVPTVKPAWHVIGASVQGTSHQKRDDPCQDAHCYRVLSDEVVVVAVADGAGSAQHSDAGAQCAVDQAIAGLEAALSADMPGSEEAWDALLVEVFCEARRAVVGLAEADELSPRAFATTLTCGVVTDDWLVVAQIGDGVVVARDEGGQLFAATEPQHGEYANETFFLTMTDALEKIDVRVYPQRVGALALMTDGLIRLAMKVTHNEPHPPFFEPLFAFTAQIDDRVKAQEQLANLLASEKVCARTDDDKTLVLVARPSGVEPKSEPAKDIES